MTTLTIEKKIKRVPKLGGSLFNDLTSRLLPRAIQNKKMNEMYLAVLNLLIEVLALGVLRGKEKAAIKLYVESVSHFLEEYEKSVFPVDDIPAAEMLEFLMEQSNLTQEHVASILKTSQPVVSEILKEKRKLTSEHIERLSRHFNISPAVFFPNRIAA